MSRVDSCRELLLECLRVPRWADELIAGAPYVSSEQFLADAHRAAAVLTDSELAEALSDHPRIGELGSRQSRAEQSNIDVGQVGVAWYLGAGNAAYERQFGRVFLIRAAGRTAEEVLTELDRRRGNSADAER